MTTKCQNYPKSNKQHQKYIYACISLMYVCVFLVLVVILVRNKCILWLPLLCRLDVWVVRDRPACLQWKSSSRSSKQTHPWLQSVPLSGTFWYKYSSLKVHFNVCKGSKQTLSWLQSAPFSGTYSGTYCSTF